MRKKIFFSMILPIKVDLPNEIQKRGQIIVILSELNVYVHLDRDQIGFVFSNSINRRERGARREDGFDFYIQYSLFRIRYSNPPCPLVALLSL